MNPAIVLVRSAVRIFLSLTTVTYISDSQSALKKNRFSVETLTHVILIP